MNIISASSPKFTKDGNIDLIVNFEKLGEINFTASASDIEAHSREIYARALTGEFGVVKEFTSPISILKQLDYENAVQDKLDSEAAMHGYGSSNISPSVSARSYAGYPNQFQNECILYGQWCSNCWSKCYEILAEVTANTRSIPTIEELIAELPVLVWP